MTRILLIVGLFAGVVVRFIGLMNVPAVITETDSRAEVLAVINATGESTRAVRSFAFAPSAEVVLGVGPDGQPGQANVNDNADSAMDDAGELGAVGSDDVCLAPSDSGYQVVAEDDRSIVISRGAFVEQPDANDRFQVEGIGWFIPAR